MLRQAVFVTAAAAVAAIGVFDAYVISDSKLGAWDGVPAAGHRAMCAFKLSLVVPVRAPTPQTGPVAATMTSFSSCFLDGSS